MAVLSKNDILQKIKAGEIKFSPEVDTFQMKDHAVDLRLGFTFMIPKLWELTDKGRVSLETKSVKEPSKEKYDIIELEAGQYFEILPQEYVLVSTLENIKMPENLVSILYPRSSINRRGLSLDLTGLIDAGYEGQLVLPIKNNTKSQAVRLYPGERVCQITFEEISNPTNPTKSRYHQRDVIEGLANEKNSELLYITRGDIKGLKENFKI